MTVDELFDALQKARNLGMGYQVVIVSHNSGCAKDAVEDVVIEGTRVYIKC